MPMATEDELTSARQEVQRLFGHCLLRLQGYELLLKAVVATHEISAPISGIADVQAHRVAGARNKTLGALMGEMIGSFIIASGSEGMGSPPDDMRLNLVQHAGKQTLLLRRTATGQQKRTVSEPGRWSVSLLLCAHAKTFGRQNV